MAEKRASDGAAFVSPAKYPTLESLLTLFKKSSVFDGERVTLWKVLQKLGFKYKQVNDKRYVYEQSRIIV